MPSMFTAETLEVSLIYTETFLVILLCSVKVTSMGVIREIIWYDWFGIGHIQAVLNLLLVVYMYLFDKLISI